MFEEEIVQEVDNPLDDIWDESLELWVDVCNPLSKLLKVLVDDTNGEDIEFVDTEPNREDVAPTEVDDTPMSFWMR